jgi:hypothetical protein
MLYTSDRCTEIVNGVEKGKLCNNKVFGGRGQGKVCNSPLVKLCDEWKKHVDFDIPVGEKIYRDVYDGAIWKEFQSYNQEPFLVNSRNLGLMINNNNNNIENLYSASQNLRC